MARNVPSYLESVVAEGAGGVGGAPIAANELKVCQIEAIEEQTDAIKNQNEILATIAAALERIADNQ